MGRQSEGGIIHSHALAPVPYWWGAAHGVWSPSEDHACARMLSRFLQMRWGCSWSSMRVPWQQYPQDYMEGAKSILIVHMVSIIHLLVYFFPCCVAHLAQWSHLLDEELLRLWGSLLDKLQSLHSSLKVCWGAPRFFLIKILLSCVGDGTPLNPF